MGQDWSNINAGQVAVRLTAEEREQLRELAKTEGKTTTALARSILRAAIRKRYQQRRKEWE
jgi:predicted DNA-binding protein